MSLNELNTTVTLEDKYTLPSGRVYMTGTQALVRLLLAQKQRDAAAGLNTGGFVSGYRGSPLGAVDQELWKASKHLEAHNIKFVPGLNEELAATAVWGSQMLSLDAQAQVDGVFALWYGKGPGVDRSGDVFKHGNIAGCAKHGGVLLIAGDDHSCKSSSLPHQSEHAFIAAMIPVMNPSGVREFIEFGLHGYAMSRYSGCWVGFKSISDTIESSSSFEIDPMAVEIKIPDTYPIPADGFHIRWPDPPLEQENRLQRERLYALLDYVRLNKLNRQDWSAPQAKLGIVTTGKSYLDVREALAMMGISDETAQAMGVRLLKIGVSWPLEPQCILEFADGLDEILVVEEKRQIIEYQIKEQLYNAPIASRPRVVGKYDETGEWVQVPHGGILLSPNGELTPAAIANVIAARIAKVLGTESLGEKGRDYLIECKAADGFTRVDKGTEQRLPYFCSGCPHNTSTKVPEGSFALAGIGCHVMATAIYPEFNKLTTHMGGEGGPWIGQAPFSQVPHVFANLGDGTYFHSGYLAIRAAVAANVNMTYKILYNDAVAMTGGQPVDGTTSVPMIAQQMAAEGIKRIALVSEDLSRYSDRSNLPALVTIHDRKDMDAVQREMREVPGVTVIIYDQTCAAEKRRRRKKGEYPDPDQRLFINEAVCEGCGDCGMQSNCTSILPLETEFGRKRAIDQSSCNKDYSCVKGFCPSFVTVSGGKLKKSKTGVIRKDSADDFGVLPEPAIPSCDTPFNILINGIGGTGVITIGALMGMAAHLEGKGASVLDMTGMSQKNGSVTSHVRIARTPQAIRAQRIATGEADLILGCDMLTAGSHDAISKMRPGRTRAVVNVHQQPPGQFAKNPDWQFPFEDVKALIQESVDDQVDFIDATRLATALMGDSIATNLFMLGYAYQRGELPLTEAALLRAIEMNGVAVESNKTSFLWGRRAAVDLARVERIAVPAQPVVIRMPETLDKLIKRRVAFLTDYQDAAYAESFARFVEQVRAKETALNLGDKLSMEVARNLSKLMAYKDEYEVARLYTDGRFMEQLKQQFEGDFSLSFNLAPPLFSKKDAQGRLVKAKYGSWMMSAFKVLAKFKGLRGGSFDVFGYTEERKTERRLIAEYRETVASLLDGLSADKLALAVEIAQLPEQIRGYGHVKDKALAQTRGKQDELLARYATAAVPVGVGLAQKVNVASIAAA